jgi:hypothetical protein
LRGAKRRGNLDGLAKGQKTPFFVIPAKAGIQKKQAVKNLLDPGACPGPYPGFSGVTTFYEAVNLLTVHVLLRLRPPAFAWVAMTAVLQPRNILTKSLRMP